VKQEGFRYVCLAALAATLLGCGCLPGRGEGGRPGRGLPLPEMVVVEAGVFLMGSESGSADERPVHSVEISRSFAMAATPVSLALWDIFCEEKGQAPLLVDVEERQRYPVTRASWFQAITFCNWLSEREGRTPCYRKGYGSCDFDADGYRLPTEAEWEFAARGGNKSRGTLYAGSDDPDEVAWYKKEGSEGADSHPGVRLMGLKKPNELGLYDMSGNCLEWCWDWYDPNYYSVSPPADPTGPRRSASIYGERVRRGGLAGDVVTYCRVAKRSADSPDWKAGAVRLVYTLSEQP